MASDTHTPSTQAAGSQGLEVKPDGIRADGGSGRQAAAMRSEIVSPDGTELSRPKATSLLMRLTRGIVARATTRRSVRL
jgi:hypothetical protein